MKSIINTPSDTNVDWDHVVKKEARGINDATWQLLAKNLLNHVIFYTTGI